MGTIGSRLKSVRETDYNLNQANFGQLFGVSAAAISEIERDKNSPSLTILKEVMVQKNIDLKWLLLGDGQRYIKDGNTTAKMTIIDLVPVLEKMMDLLDDSSQEVLQQFIDSL